MAKRRPRKALRKDPTYALVREYKASVMPTASYETLGAHAVGIGRKIVNGKPTDQLALRIYVAKKLPMTAVPPSERVPQEIPFFSRGLNKDQRVLTDVIETPPAVFELDPTDRVRPAPGGVSVDGISGTAGTLGGWVWDTTDDTIVSLSNHHVYGHVAGPDVIQPGPFDGGASPADKIGDVKRGIQRLAGVTNTVDCAIADADSSDIYDLSVPEIPDRPFTPSKHRLSTCWSRSSDGRRSTRSAKSRTTTWKRRSAVSRSTIASGSTSSHRRRTGRPAATQGRWCSRRRPHPATPASSQSSGCTSPGRKLGPMAWLARSRTYSHSSN